MIWRKEGNVPSQCVRTRQERLEGQRKSQNTAGSWRKEEASKSRENKPGMKIVARERERWAQVYKIAEGTYYVGSILRKYQS